MPKIGQDIGQGGVHFSSHDKIELFEELRLVKKSLYEIRIQIFFDFEQR
jgi:hypothetical protein